MKWGNVSRLRGLPAASLAVLLSGCFQVTVRSECDLARFPGGKRPLDCSLQWEFTPLDFRIERCVPVDFSLTTNGSTFIEPKGHYENVESYHSSGNLGLRPLVRTRKAGSSATCFG